MCEKINIAIVGFGNIGSYFYKILEKNKISISTLKLENYLLLNIYQLEI